MNIFEYGNLRYLLCLFQWSGCHNVFLTWNRWHHRIPPQWAFQHDLEVFHPKILSPKYGNHINTINIVKVEENTRTIFLVREYYSTSVSTYPSPSICSETKWPFLWHIWRITRCSFGIDVMWKPVIGWISTFYMAFV